MSLEGMARQMKSSMAWRLKVTFGYIPSGSGNDLGRGLGISAKDPLEALQRILEAEQVRYMDLGRVSWHDRGIRQSRLYAISAGIGFDVFSSELSALHAKLKTFKPYRTWKISLSDIDRKEYAGFAGTGCLHRI